MIIREDRSYLEQLYLDRWDFISHGLAFQNISYIDFLYDPRQAEQTQGSENDPCAMLMEAIADHFTMYQYHHDSGIKFDSDEWELFFWCRVFNVNGTSRQDYTYVKLSFNSRHSEKRQSDILDRLLEFLRINYARFPVQITLQYGVVYLDDKIRAAVLDAAQRFDTIPCTWKGMEGRLISQGTGFKFMKKRARKNAYIPNDRDIMRIVWEQEEIIWRG